MKKSLLYLMSMMLLMQLSYAQSELDWLNEPELANEQPQKPAPRQPSPYNQGAAGKNVFDEALPDQLGKVPQGPVILDEFGNPQGSQYDLARDNAFDDYKVAVLHLYSGEGFDFRYPNTAIGRKGFEIMRWTSPPNATELKLMLEKASQLWIISHKRRLLNAEHLKVIKDFFNSGRGIYIWGENEPYYADANYVASALLGAELYGNWRGDQIVGLKSAGGSRGLVPNHLVSTGISNIYEGITVSSIRGSGLTPLLYGSEGNLIAAAYEKEGKRAIIDGGFTRLFLKWDTAGTGRYVKNAAAWLANYERFGGSGGAGGVPAKPTVELVAALLSEMGYYSGSLSKVNENAVKRGLKDFQNDFGLKATGQLDKATWAELSSMGLSAETKAKMK